MTLFDPGLQTERTELAWRRTALALGLGSLLALRLLPATFKDPLWIIAGVGGLIASASIWAIAHHRYRVVSAILIQHGDRSPLPGAQLLAALSTVVSVVGIIALALVIFASRS